MAVPIVLAYAVANEHSRSPLKPEQAAERAEFCGARQSGDSLKACLKNGSRRREEAEKRAILARNPPPHVGGYGAHASLRARPTYLEGA